MLKQIDELDLKNIYLATKNPRIADKINFDDINGDFFRENQENNDEKNLKELLAYEGNCDNLLELFKSIENKYNDMLEKPILINSNNKNEYIVVEGNRRIMVLKCLHSLIKFPKNIDERNFMIEDEFTLDNKNEDEKIEKKKIEKNFKKINKIIEEYQLSNLSNNEFKLKVNIIEKDKEENKEISIAIFSNHVTGDKRGKRNWNRGKTLDMYMNFWQTNKIKDVNQKIKQISNLLNKSESNVKDNLHSASFIYYLIDKSGMDKNIYYKQVKISSLERQFIKKFINFNNEKRWDEEIEYEKNLDYQKIKFKSKKNKFKDKELAKFILDSLKNNYFSTRGIVQKNEDEALDKISIFFGESKNVFEEDFKKGIYELRNKNINRIIENKSSLKNKNLLEFVDFIEKSREIVKNNSFKIIYENKLSKKLKPFKKTFNNLFNQFKLLSENKKIRKLKDFPINATMSTLRSLIENFCYFLMFDRKLFNKFKENENFKKIQISGKKISRQNNFQNLKFEDLFLNEKASNLHKTYNFLRIKFKEDNQFYLQILKSIKFLINNNSIQKIENLNTIFDDLLFKKISKIIHSQHLLFLDNNDKELNIFKKNKLFLENLINLFKEIKIIE